MPSVEYGTRALLKLAWPVVVARASQAVVGFSDALMISRLGESELAAVTTGSINFQNGIVLAMGLVFIVQSFASQLKAKGDMRAAIRYARYGLLVSVAAGGVSLLAIPLIPWMVSAFGYEFTVGRSMTTYLSIRVAAVTAILGSEAIGNWYGGIGKTSFHMVSGLSVMVTNILLNWVLIEGRFGFPALGVQGAAIASVAASWIGFGFLAVVFFSGRFHPAVDPGPLRLSEAFRMIRFGLPNGLNWFLEFSAFTFFINWMVADLGTTVLAAFMVVLNINAVSFMPAFGLSNAGAILSGQAIGAGKKELVSRVVLRTLLVAAGWQMLIGLSYVLAPEFLIRLFSEDAGSSRLLEIGALLLSISAAWQLFDAVAMSVGETLRAAGDTAWCLWARLSIAWLLFLPGAWFTVRYLEGGYVAAMLCIVGYLVVLAAVLSVRFLRGAWKSIDLTGSENGVLIQSGQG